MIVKLLVEGGNMKPGPAVAQKLGPLGINMGKVIEEVNKATQGFKGLKVPVELNIDTKTKEVSVSVSSPPVSELIKKELGIEKASGESEKLKAGNFAIEQVIKIAKTKQQDMLDKSLKSAVKSVIGSCVSLGVLIENEEPKRVSEQITSGKYDKEIEQGKDEADPEKLRSLKQFYEQLKTKQEAIIKKEEEEKAKEEEKKVKTKEEEKPEEKKPEEEKPVEGK